MANKTVLKKEKKLNSRQEVVTSHPVMRGLIYSFIFPKSNRILRTNAYSVKKIYLFLESNDQYGRKNSLVQMRYYMTREFSLTFSRINRQTSETSIPTEKCFKLAQKPCGRVGKRNNLNGISTAFRCHFRWKLFAFSEVPGLKLLTR